MYRYTSIFQDRYSWKFQEYLHQESLCKYSDRKRWAFFISKSKRPEHIRRLFSKSYACLLMFANGYFFRINCGSFHRAISICIV